MSLLNKLFGKRKVDAPEKVLERIEPVQQKTEKKKRDYSFKTAGVNADFDNGKEIIARLRDNVPLSKDFDLPALTLLKKKKTEVYQFEGKGAGVTFIDEPDNPYDSSAVRIEIKNIGFVGYVPKNKQPTVKSFRFGKRKENLKTIKYEIYGGNVREIDDNRDEDRDPEDIDDYIDESDEFTVKIIFVTEE